jgi:hypothetical protein
MIYECLSSSKLLVLINGSPSKEFSVRRGLLQGDPISPFLFDIAAEGLSVLFQRASSDIMGYMGFGRKWRTMIYECLSSSKLSVLINESPSKEFSVRRGLLQGDPISPFLFDIVAEGLSVLFQRASSGNIIKGL